MHFQKKPDCFCKQCRTCRIELQNVQVSDPEINSGQAPQAMIVVMQLATKKMYYQITNSIKTYY